MSKKVTFEQAKKLKEIGFNVPTLDYLREHDSGLVSEFSTSYAGSENWNAQQRKVYSRPTVSSALDWIREEKKIECGVYPFAEESKDEQNPIIIRYEYRFISYQRNPATKMNDLFCKVATFDTHHLASSALLDAVLTYLEQKEKK